LADIWLVKLLNGDNSLSFILSDLGYRINHAMFQRNGRTGYVLKPEALRNFEKDLLSKRTQHFLDVSVRGRYFFHTFMTSNHFLDHICSTTPSSGIFRWPGHRQQVYCRPCCGGLAPYTRLVCLSFSSGICHSGRS
jgi:hypothetical protein